MEVQSMDKEDAAREKGIYHVTVVGSGVNFLLLLFKFFAGTRDAGIDSSAGFHRF